MAWTDEARAGRDTIPPERKKAFNNGMAALRADPYQCGSSAVGDGRNRRDAAIGGVAIIRYEVSPNPQILVITVLRLIALP
ncbi:hypothetical protein J1792_09260 [Streptomyces triculaminicus]|uniref:Uncharacterized protein n=1 Tax=Streptomyces triculaminicus TaxID=2816232 RepID=A0A939FN36_9ACTN|nr:hypothetical protein [Streptomyces triculaminicus]MBO0652972.1 hypothetical protein [Streptomyces triculaminicus]